MTRWRGLLIDVGGVLQVSDRLLPGAVEALTALRRQGVSFRLLSNTSSRSRARLAASLQHLGLPVTSADLWTATVATAEYLRAVGGASLFVVAEDARADLVGLPEDGDHPAHVVVGDTPEAFGRAMLNRAFRALRGGADLVAMANNRWFATADGPAIDVGAAVAALEYAADVRATVIGKPSPAIFHEGARQIGLPPADVAMVGDDPEADVLAARAAGLGGIYVGATWPFPDRPPDAVIHGVAELPALVARDGG